MLQRINWLKWRMRCGDPKTRTHDIKFFLGFEFYNLGCRLSKYEIYHWLDLEQRPPRPAGKYLRVVRPAPLLVRLMDCAVSYGEESHSDYFPYTPEAEAQIKLAGGRVGIVEISYRLRAEVY
jgi:hypothetical protein